MKTNTRGTKNRGFTLVELLLVITILGVLAAVVIPTFASASAETAQKSFASCLKTFTEAALYYEAKNNEFPEDGSSGQCPSGWEDYIDEHRWTNPTPVGGVWDTETDGTGYSFALGVHYMVSGDNPGDAFMTVVDNIIDDGILTTGCFRKIASDRYYIIVAP